MAIMLILALMIITILAVGAVFLFSASKEDADKKDADADSLVLKPKLVPGDYGYRPEKSITGINMFSIAKYAVFFVLILIAWPYINNTLFKERGRMILNIRRPLHSLSKAEYRTICLGTLKPALEGAMGSAMARAFSGDSDTKFDLDQTLDGIAKQFGLPCGNSVLNLCAAAENQYNPDGETRIFQ